MNETAVELRVGRFRDIRVIVDPDDVDRVMTFVDNWSMHKGGYVCRFNGKTLTLMHRSLFGEIKPGLVVHHLNNNKLDNRKCNLEAITQRENVSERLGCSKYGTNITFDANHKFRVTPRLNGVKQFLGGFNTLEEAKRVRDAWYTKHNLSLPVE